MPAVSVIMPVYNGGVLLDRAVRSILAQTLTDLELILIDDGSDDDSPARCEAWAGRDPRVRVLHQERRGPGPARAAGIAAAAGAYVGFADSDDYALPELYRVLFAAAAGDGAAAVKCGAFVLPAAAYAPPGPQSEAEALRRWPELRSGQYYYAAQEIAGAAILRYLSNNLLDNSLWTLLLSADLCRAVPFTERLRMEDSYFYMELAGRLDRLRLLPERLYLYLARPDSVSRSANPALLLERAAHDRELFQRAAALGQADTATNAFNRLARTLNQYGAGGERPATEADLRLYLEIITFFRDNMARYLPAHRAHQAEDPFAVRCFLLPRSDGTETALDFATVAKLDLL
ncbi:MAG: glycosyltransferase [Gracilibacteraceae bacterium]|jgi:glycosyltransferase involved in cell wall biosynthesis|nr:glycosyltransferase [Gracilibacteraceae bacterium]